MSLVYCLYFGMDAHISKPIDFTSCLRMIERFVRLHSSGVSLLNGD